MKRQTTDWEKILANHISDKVLASRTYKEFSKLNRKKNHPIKKMGKRLEQTYPKKIYTLGDNSPRVSHISVQEAFVTDYIFKDVCISNILRRNRSLSPSRERASLFTVK